jgi:hypothetical protein
MLFEDPGVMRYQATLHARFSLRWHMAALVAFTALGGLGANSLLLYAGLTPMELRFPLSVLFSWALFFGLVRSWVFLVSDEVERRPVSDLGTAGVAMAGVVVLPEDRQSRFPWGDLSDLPVPDDGEGALVFALVALAACAVGGAGYLVWKAPVILPEVATQAAGVGVSRDWAGTLLRKTALPFLLLAAVASGAGWVAHSQCPEATRLGAALSCRQAVSGQAATSPTAGQ